MPLFAVIRTRGSAWRESQPLEGSADVLLIVKADTADEIRSRLAEDPWSRNDLLRIARITPWTLRLGSLG